MASKDHDRLIALAANMAAPTVVAEIDAALADNEHEREELLELRKWAVRRHGDVHGATTQTDSDAVRVAGAPVSTAPVSAPVTSATTAQTQAELGGTFTSLIESYRSDERSSYQQLRHATKSHYDTLIRRLLAEIPDARPGVLTAADIQRMYDAWRGGGKVSMAHALVGMVRILANFGMVTLHDPDCERLSVILSRMRFPLAKSRTEHLTKVQAQAIIQEAHRSRQHSIALAQALQTECGLAQKDVIGEWVPLDDPIESNIGSNTESTIIDLESGTTKWVRGVVWSKVDENWVLQHAPSRGGPPVDYQLANCPMVMAAIARIWNLGKPERGPMVISERTFLPYSAVDFRRRWRDLANRCGIPKNIRNMDSASREWANDLPDTLDLSEIEPNQDFQEE